MNESKSLIKETLNKLRKKEISCFDLVQSFIKQIEKVENKVDAFLILNFDQALQKAQQFDKKGDFSLPLAGIPISIKDAICTKDLKTTAGSLFLKDFTPPYNATVIEKLEKNGAIILGKTNTDEFTMGSSCENSAFKNTKNPWDLTRVPGGSSGGPAASIAANECICALGTDTGGSIRQPANFCGIVGLKPTYGRVSRFGAIPYASSFDTVGPMGKSVEDVALMLEIIAGYDPKDTTTSTKKVEKYSQNLSQEIKGKTLGIPKEFLHAKGLDKRIKNNFYEIIKSFEKSFQVTFKEISLSLTEYMIPTYYLLAKSEASVNLSKFDGVRFGSKTKEANSLEEFYKKTRGENFGPEVKRAIMMGTFALSAGYFDAFYQKASCVRALIKQEFDQIFKEVEAIFAPVSPFLPFKIGDKVDDPLSMYLADIFTVGINLAGIPSLALPTGLIEGLPTGLQIISKQFAENNILNLGWHLEKMVNFKEEPKLA